MKGEGGRKKIVIRASRKIAEAANGASEKKDPTRALKKKRLHKRVGAVQSN